LQKGEYLRRSEHFVSRKQPETPKRFGGGGVISRKGYESSYYATDGDAEWDHTFGRKRLAEEKELFRDGGVSRVEAPSLCTK